MDEPALEIWVDGMPRPKGSLKHAIAKAINRADAQRCPHCRGPVRVVPSESVKGSSTWRREVAVLLRDAWGGREPLGACWAQVHFYFDRPTGETMPYPTKRQYGDLDKLQRNVFDAVTDAGVWADDSGLVGLSGGGKWWAQSRAGMWLRIWEAT